MTEFSTFPCPLHDLRDVPGLVLHEEDVSDMLTSSPQATLLMVHVGVADSAHSWITLTAENMSSKEILKPTHVSLGLQAQLPGCHFEQAVSLK